MTAYTSDRDAPAGEPAIPETLLLALADRLSSQWLSEIFSIDLVGDLHLVPRGILSGTEFPSVRTYPPRIAGGAAAWGGNRVDARKCRSPRAFFAAEDRARWGAHKQAEGHCARDVGHGQVLMSRQ